MKTLSPIRIAASASLFALSLFQLSATPAPALAAVAIPDGTAAQEPAGFGPLDPTPPAGVTTEEIIKKFGERESAFKKARDNYTFRQTVKVDTLTEDTNRVDGEYQQVTDITFNADGKREEHVVFAPQNTLERVMMSPVDFDEIEHRLPFILTTEDQPKYKIDYLGRQHVDELEHLRLRRRTQDLREEPALLPGKSLGRSAGLPDCSHQRHHRPPGQAQRPRRPAASLHHLLRAGRR